MGKDTPTLESTHRNRLGNRFPISVRSAGSATCSHWLRSRQVRAVAADRTLDSGRHPTLNAPHPLDGAVAQLGERVVRNDEVRSSILLSSTSGIHFVLSFAPPAP